MLELDVRPNEGECLPIYILQLGDLLPQQGRLLYLTTPTSPRETQKYILHLFFWGLLPRLTTEVLPRYSYMTKYNNDISEWKENISEGGTTIIR